MKQLIILSCSFLLLISFTEKPFVNPTGTYIMGASKKVDDDFYGYSGMIQVRMLKSGRIAISFGINKGAPSYNSGTFSDTLLYRNNIAVYTPGKNCKLIFRFRKNGVSVEELSNDPGYKCSFGGGVVANGFFKKTSSLPPVLVDMSTGEKL
jgi:hypothetical protein